MNIKLHNKYEVFCGDKKYVAYNTMLKTVFEKLKKLEPYNSYFAFGSGTTDVTFDDYALESYTATYPATTEQYQTDVLSGTMFVVKGKIFDKDEAEGFSFSEIGITDTNETNPAVYNRVVFKDENDQPVTITKVAGERLRVKLTIYFEIEPTSKVKLVAGENLLVKQLLGENAVTNKNFVIIKSDNTSPNVPIHREAPTQYTPLSYDKFQYDLKDYSGFRTVLTCDFGQGEVIEVLILLDGQPVLRYNCQNDNIGFTSTKYVEGKIIMTFSGLNQ